MVHLHPLADRVEIELVGIDEDHAPRLEGGDLVDELRADRAARARHGDAAPANEARDLGRVKFHLVAAEKVFQRDGQRLDRLVGVDAAGARDVGQALHRDLEGRGGFHDA